MSEIVDIEAREVFDSRGRPTVEVEVTCRGALPARAIVPSGASTGRFEAVELRDGGTRLGGRGVRQAVSNVTGPIAELLKGRDAADQQQIDHDLCELDGTANKSRLGANAILGTSLAVAYAEAAAQGRTRREYLHSLWRQLPAADNAADTRDLGREMLLPLPMVNMISGGLHAGGQLSIQDFLAVPIGATSYSEALEWIVTLYLQLQQVLLDQGYEAHLVGDEGGFGPRLPGNRRALEILVEAMQQAGFEPGRQMAIAMDVAASHFLQQDGRYALRESGEGSVSASGMIDLLQEWVDEFPIVSIEDALAEDDWDGWQELTRRLGDSVQLIGDDLFVTSVERVREGISRGAANGVLIKLNQVGSLWETLQTIRVTLDAGFRPVISARSGETEDVTIADLAVATGAGQLKVGSVARSERLAKYNHLLRVEQRSRGQIAFAGKRAFA